MANIQVEKKGPVTTVIINRPEVRNAVDRQTAQELADAFREFEADEGARVGVLTGAGGYFCAGADLKALAEGHSNRLEKDGDHRRGGRSRGGRWT
jgi:enoyl-CoA hydratase